LPSALTGHNKGVVGTWKRTFDWSCDGSVGITTDTIRADFTWFSSGGFSGTWTLEGDNFTYNYPGGTSYRGKVNSTSSSMSGTMTSYTGSTGCWSSIRVAGQGMSGGATDEDLQQDNVLLEGIQSTEDAPHIGNSDHQ